MRKRYVPLLVLLLAAAVACGSGAAEDAAALDWERVDAPCSYDSDVIPITFTDAFFALCALDGTVWRSADGLVWEQSGDLDRYLRAGDPFSGGGASVFAATASGLVIRTGSLLLFSPDGASWSKSVLPIDAEFDYDSGFAAGAAGAIAIATTHRRAWVSRDGKRYIETTVPQFDGTTTVHVTDAAFVLTAVELPISRDDPLPGWSNVAWYSTDGINWERTPPGPMLEVPFDLVDGMTMFGGDRPARSLVTGSAGRYLAVARMLGLNDVDQAATPGPAELVQSSDGIAWAEADFGLAGVPIGAARGDLGTLIIMHTETPIWWYSADGRTGWEQAPQEVSAPADNQIPEFPETEFGFETGGFGVGSADPDRYAMAVGAKAIVVFDRFRPGELAVGTER